MFYHKYIIIDTNKKISGTSSDFIYKFNYPIEIDQEIKLLYASVINTCYNIHNNQNIYIQLYDNTYYTLNLIPGNYTINNLITHIQSLISTNIQDCTIIYNQITFKISFLINNNSFKKIIFSDDQLTNLLGFYTNHYENSNGFISLTSTKIVNLISNNLLYITLDELGINPIFQNSNIECDFLLSLNGNSGDYIYYDYQTSGLDNINTLKTKKIFNQCHVNIKNQNNDYYNNNDSQIIMIFRYN